MDRDTLFLLPPGFIANERREYCPECAELWGVLNYYPFIKEALIVRYETIEHPRAGLTELLGDGEWNCPTIVLAAGADPGPVARTERRNGYRFIDNARDIGRYFSHRFGTAFPRGG